MRCPTSGPGDGWGCYADGTLVRRKQSRPLFVITHAVDWDTFEDVCQKLDVPQRHGPERIAGRDPKGVAFRLYDEDNNLYYRGRYYGTGDGFAPLDWAMGEAGCTRIDLYEKRPDGTWKWSTL